MARRRSLVPGWLLALVVLGAITLVLVQLPADAFWTYSWVMFPGIFVVAIAGRLVEEQVRKRRRARFKDDR